MVVAGRMVSLERGHAEILLPMIEGVLKDGSIGYHDLTGIAVTRGPGAFTGIRIGLAAARGLGLATGLPVAGVTTLEALALTASGHTSREQIAVIMDTKRRDFFVQIFERDPSTGGVQAISTPAVVAGDALTGQLTSFEGHSWDQMAVAGDGMAQPAAPGLPASVEILAEITSPSPLSISMLARTQLAKAPAPPAPLYLRPPEARLPATRS